MKTRRILAIFVASLLTLVSHAAASTLPGRNGPLAAISYSRRIGIVTPAHRLRILHATHLREEFILDLSFSPSGRDIAFAEASAGLSSFLTLLDVRGGDVKGVGTRGVGVGNLSYLSNGNIVFSGSRRSNRPPRGTFEISGNGGHLHRLFGAQEVAASADGHWFLSTDARGSYLSLFLLDTQGRRVGRVTPDRDPAFRYRNPTFSPNGHWVAYERDVERRGHARRSDIFVVRRDGTHRRRVTHGGVSAQPTFSPDGRWLAFAQSNRSFSSNIYAALVRHPSRRKALTRIRRASLQNPTWAADPR
jgi:Tol biopolymer transport system component